MVTCETVTEAVCEDEVSGYTARPRCSSVPRQQCSLAKQRVQKVTPETSCDKQPVEVCAPRGCGFVNVRYSLQFCILNWILSTSSLTNSHLQGPVICTDRVKTIVVDKPVEECALEPIKSCNQVRDHCHKYNLIVNILYSLAR